MTEKRDDSSSIVPSFTASAEMEDALDHIRNVLAPALLNEKGFALILVDDQGRQAFDAWQERDRFNPCNKGTATFGKFFGLRVPDTPESIQEALTALDVLENGRYIIAHHPNRRGKISFTTPLALSL